jgi:hypothetical protein
MKQAKNRTEKPTPTALAARNIDRAQPKKMGEIKWRRSLD